VSEAFIELANLIREAGLQLRLYGRPVTEQQVLEYATQHSKMRTASMANINDMANIDVSANWKASDELDGIRLGTAEEERERAKLWMDTAAQHLRNEEYWRNRCRKAEEVIHEFVRQASKAGYTMIKAGASNDDD
jgi:hypothetical protein